jgi:hypothetical protein
MDVVRANVERIGGVVDVDSKLGQGVRFTLRVPLTLTIIPALTVSAGGQTFAIPRSAIEEIVRSKNDSVRVEALGGSHVARIRGKRIPLTWLADVLGVPAEVSPSEQSFIVLKPAGGDVYALGVDVVHDHEELVIKPAAPVVMATGLYAGTTLADDGSPILRLSDGAAEIAYGFADVADLVSLSGEMKPAASAGEVSGVTLIAGEQVEIIDTYWLFADCAIAHDAGGAKPVCALPTDDPWMNTILRPIIEGAGYQVVSHADAEAADILITNAEDENVPASSSGEVVRIRSSAEVRGKGDDSIYRYDRTGLISALSRHAAKRNRG